MDLPTAIFDEARGSATLWVTLAAVAAAITVGRSELEDRRRVKSVFVFLGLHLVLVGVAAVLATTASPARRDVHLAALFVGILCGVTATGGFLFRGLLPRLRIRVPRILQDVAVGGVAAAAVLILASRSGFDLSSIIATSAVLTAVIGLSLQDTLGNIIGGLALQTDDSLQVGDWVRIGDYTGKVVEIRWRYTAIETRNWETVVVPNSVLVKNQVLVLGRRRGQPTQWRRWVWFNVDYRYQPTDVIAAVNAGLQKTPIPNVALDPAAHAIVMDFSDSWGRYAVRYWLTDLARDDPTDSRVREVIFFALARAGMSLSIPAHAVFVTKEGAARREEKSKRDKERRLAAISRVDLFASLPEDDRRRLAAALIYAPFAAGETLTSQGTQAHWLYIIEDGECAVTVRVDDGEREVARLRSSEFFGEMSLLTGAERSASVVAITDVECWRLDREAFQELLDRRPQLAEVVAHTLAERQVGLDSVREGLSQEARARRTAAEAARFADRIRQFFGLEAPGGGSG